MEYVLYIRIYTARTATDAGGQRFIIVRPDLAGTPNYLRAVDGTPLDLADVAQGDGGETEVAGIYAGLRAMDAHLREVGYLGRGNGTVREEWDALATALVALGDGGNDVEWPFHDPRYPTAAPLWWGDWGILSVDTPDELALYYPDAGLNR